MPSENEFKKHVDVRVIHQCNKREWYVLMPGKDMDIKIPIRETQAYDIATQLGIYITPLGLPHKTN